MTDPPEDAADNGPITAVEAIDDLTVTVTFNAQPGLAIWGPGTGITNMPIQPAHFWQPVVDEALASDDPSHRRSWPLRASRLRPSVRPSSVSSRKAAFAASTANEIYYDAGHRAHLGWRHLDRRPVCDRLPVPALRWPGGRGSRSRRWRGRLPAEPARDAAWLPGPGRGESGPDRRRQPDQRLSVPGVQPRPGSDERSGLPRCADGTDRQGVRDRATCSRAWPSRCTSSCPRATWRGTTRKSPPSWPRSATPGLTDRRRAQADRDRPADRCRLHVGDRLRPIEDVERRARKPGLHRRDRAHRIRTASRFGQLELITPTASYDPLRAHVRELHLRRCAGDGHRPRGDPDGLQQDRR